MSNKTQRSQSVSVDSKSVISSIKKLSLTARLKKQKSTDTQSTISLQANSLQQTPTKLTTKNSSTSLRRQFSIPVEAVASSSTSSSDDYERQQNVNKKPPTSLMRTLSSKFKKYTNSKQIIYEKTNGNSNGNHNNTDRDSLKSDTSSVNLEIMYKVFDYFDHEKKGFITINDVERVICKLEFLKNEIELPSKDKICESFNKYSSPEIKGALGFNEFLKIMNHTKPNENCNATSSASTPTTSNTISSPSSHSIISVNAPMVELNGNHQEKPKVTIDDIFKQFDVNVDGKITRDELKKVMISLFPNDNISDDDINNMLNEADFDRNGHIDFKEFSEIFNSLNKQYNIDKLEADEKKRESFLFCGLLANMDKKDIQSLDLKQAFTMFDKNGDNKISPSELQQAMIYLGLKPSEQEVQQMVKVVDTNCNGYVDYDEFHLMMTQTHIKPKNDDDELREAFKAFDRDGNGFITAEEIKKTMSYLGENLTDEEVSQMIKSADKNGDGRVDITEFTGLLKCAK